MTAFPDASMTLEPEIALVLSADRWVEELHRHCADHGGARVRCMVVDPSVALEERYDVLVVSHRWPALTRSFVSSVRATGARVLGVHPACEPQGATFLRSLGVDAVAVAGAPSELVAAIVALTPLPCRTPQGAEAGTRPPVPSSTAAAGTASVTRLRPTVTRGPIVVGGPHGAGRTEVSLALACALRAAGARVVLVDADDLAPALAPRLHLPLVPNLRSAIDAVEYGLGSVEGSVMHLGKRWPAVVTGVPSARSARHVRPAEVVATCDALLHLFDLVVVDVAGGLDRSSAPDDPDGVGIAGALVRRATAVVSVGNADPVGVARLLDWLECATLLRPGLAGHVVLNRASTDRAHQADLADLVASGTDGSPVVLAPYDRRVPAAAWAATAVAPGPFTRAIAHVATGLVPVEVTARRTRRRRRLALP